MTAKDYGGLDLVLGSVIGERFWIPTMNGHLTPLSYASSEPWTPGMNEATCHGYAPADKLIEQGFMEPHPESADSSERYNVERTARNAWLSSHDMTVCEHGFYGLWAREANDFYGAKNTPVLRGVIEGSGEVLIGTKGFRAMKARILAISLEPYADVWHLDEVVVAKLKRNYPGVTWFDSTMAMHMEFAPDKVDDHYNEEVPA